MATKPKKCIGTVACLVCGEENPARLNDNGTIDMGCGYCDFTGYAKAGTEAHKVIFESIKQKPGAEPPPITLPAASVAPVAPSQEDVTAAALAPVLPRPLTFVELMSGGRKA